ncbi:MAG: hypothetical protein QXF01_01650 [Candidatus Micrarchaeaceae archaeon]
MSGRTVLNRYGLFICDLHKAIKSKEAMKCDNILRKKAALIAALSSSHSWKTYEYFSDGAKFDREAIINEKRNAFEKGWMEITEDDVEEVVSLPISEYALSMWFFYAFDREEKGEYAMLFQQIKKEFQYGLEPVERAIE